MTDSHTHTAITTNAAITPYRMYFDCCYHHYHRPSKASPAPQDTEVESAPTLALVASFKINILLYAPGNVVCL